MKFRLEIDCDNDYVFETQHLEEALRGLADCQRISSFQAEIASEDEGRIHVGGKEVGWWNIRNHEEKPVDKNGVGIAENCL